MRSFSNIDFTFDISFALFSSWLALYSACPSTKSGGSIFALDPRLSLSPVEDMHSIWILFPEIWIFIILLHALWGTRSPQLYLHPTRGGWKLHELLSALFFMRSGSAGYESHLYLPEWCDLFFFTSAEGGASLYSGPSFDKSRARMRLTKYAIARKMAVRLLLNLTLTFCVALCFFRRQLFALDLFRFFFPICIFFNSIFFASSFLYLWHFIFSPLIHVIILLYSSITSWCLLVPDSGWWA